MNQFDLRSWLQLAFSYTGQIDRRSYWMGLVVPGLLLIPYLILMPTMQSSTQANVLGTLLLLIIAWSWMALGVKRLRDRQKSPFWLAMAAIPIFGIIFLTIELGFFPGRE